MFLLTDPDGNETALEIKSTDPKNGASNFNGILGIGANSGTRIQEQVFFGPNSELYRHEDFKEYENKADMSVSNVYNLGVPINNVIDQANTEIYDFIDGLRALSVTAGAPSGDITTSINYQTFTDITVMDIDSFDMDGGSINLEGRAGENDMIVIRIANDAKFVGGAAVNLVNLDRRNVIWLTSDDSKFDLHKNERANFEGIIINPTIDDKSGKTIIGEVDFKGQVFAGSMKLGSGMDFEGSNVPEPSGGLLLLSAFGGVIFRRRR